jgi:hypothetical protein
VARESWSVKETLSFYTEETLVVGGREELVSSPTHVCPPDVLCGQVILQGRTGRPTSVLFQGTENGLRVAFAL